MESLAANGTPFFKFTLMFLLVYLFGFFGLFRNWIKHRHEASSSLMSLAHGTPAVLSSAYSMLQSQKLCLYGFASSNDAFQNKILEFSLAYFAIDTLHYIVFFPSDVLFITHHVATLYVLITCRYVVQHGAFAILGVLFLAEISSPCQNTWSLARFRKKNVAVANRYYQSMSPVFYVFYSVVRGILGPWHVVKMSFFFASGGGEGLVPIWAWVSWLVVIVGGILGSLLWILNLWKAWYGMTKGFNKSI